jgi:hypothetical protein
MDFTFDYEFFSGMTTLAESIIFGWFWYYLSVWLLKGRQSARRQAGQCTDVVRKHNETFQEYITLTIFHKYNWNGKFQRDTSWAWTRDLKTRGLVFVRQNFHCAMAVEVAAVKSSFDHLQRSGQSFKADCMFLWIIWIGYLSGLELGTFKQEDCYSFVKTFTVQWR